MAMPESEDYWMESGKPKSPGWGVRIAGMAFSAFCELFRRSDGTLSNRTLGDLLELKTPPSPTPCPLGVCTKDVPMPGAAAGLWLRIFFNPAPPHADKVPIIFHFHGGGFVYFSADFRAYDAFCRTLCSTCHAVVVSVNYRRAPEHKFPAAYDDCFAALEWLQTPDGSQHVPPNADGRTCVLMGDSAGGNIVHHVACRVAAGELGDGPLKVVGLVFLFPFFGGEERTASEVRLSDGPVIGLKSTDWFWRAFLPAGASRDHPASNVFSGPSPHFPPSLVAVAEFDLLKDRQIRYSQHLSPPARLLYIKGGVHDFHLLDKYELTDGLVCDLQSFIEKVTTVEQP